MANPTLLTPIATTLGDVCNAALRRCGYIGVGQTPLAEDLTDTWADLQWMLQSWARKRWFIFHLVDLSVVSTGQLTPYSLGPGAQIDTGANSDRPNRIESAFLRNITQGSPNNIDYPMEILQSMEDWGRVRLKTLSSFPEAAFYDSSWPNAGVRFWPVPQANLYELHVIVRAQLPVVFLTQASTFALPFEYYEAIVWNVALSACARYGIMPNPVLAMKAKTGLEMLRTGNTQIAALTMPRDLSRWNQGAFLGGGIGGGSGGSPGTTGSMTKRQVVAALADPTNPSGMNMLPTIQNSVDPLGGNAGSVEWIAGSQVNPNDPLWQLIQTAAAWSNLQMTAFQTLALSKLA